MSGRRPSRAGGRRGGGARTASPVTRTGELARRRERRSLRLRLILFGALVALLALTAAYMFWLRDSSLVAIKNLEITGIDTSGKEARQIEQAVRTAAGEMTTLHVKPEVLEEELSRFPRVAHAEIETAFPDSATVILDMRQDGSIFGEGADALLIATDGTVLGPADGQEDRLPLILDGEPPEPSAGGVETLTGRALSQALVLGAAPPELRSQIEASRMTPEGVELSLGESLTILFGDPAKADQKWRAAASLIADPEFDLDSYVDLTVPRRPAVSSAVPDEEDAAEGETEVPEAVVEG